MSDSLYPKLIVLVQKPLSGGAFSLYPIMIETYNQTVVKNNLNLPASVTFGATPACYLPPSITSFELINDGEEAFVGMYNNFYFAAYASLIFPADSIGNYSRDGITWTPAANNTDPPSHFVLVIKDFATDCTYYPSFDMWNNNFGIAWIENNPLGRLNLKYNDIPSNGNNNNNGNTPTTPSSGAAVGNEQIIFVRPNRVNVYEPEKTQSIPLNDVIITDQLNNAFNLNIFEINNPLPLGYEMTLPKVIKSVKFSQVFREHSKLECLIGTAVQASTVTTDAIPSYPLANISVTVYYGTTDAVYKSVQSDSNGKFTLDMKPGNYVFEIFVTSPSITFSQKFV